ncbi:MAG: hypothetical protein ACKV2Q_10660 [Planctomycetaceae bacterium]
MSATRRGGMMLGVFEKRLCVVAGLFEPVKVQSRDRQGAVIVLDDEPFPNGRGSKNSLPR